MARIRTIKPEFWNDEKLAQQSEGVMLTCIGILTFSDDYGVVKANPLWLKNQIFPYKDKLRIEAFSIWLDCLVKIEVLIPITSKSEQYYYIRTFRKHQKIDRPSKARNIKEDELIKLLTDKDYVFNEDGDCVKHSTNTRRTLDEHSLLDKEVVSSNSKGWEAAGEEIKTEDKLQEKKEPPPSSAPPPPDVLMMPDGFTGKFVHAWGKWIEYKKLVKKFSYKTVSTEQAALIRLVDLGKGIEANCIMIITEAISREWEGFYLPDELKNNINGQPKQAGSGKIYNAAAKDKLAERMANLTNQSQPDANGSAFHPNG